MLHSTARRALTALGAIIVASTVARAEPADPLGDLLEAASQAVPDAVIFTQNASHPLNAGDQQLFRQAVESGRRGDVNGARNAISLMTDSLARKTATWVLVDSCADSLGFNDVDAARRDLVNWPRAAKRQAAAERLIEASGQTPQKIVEWFGGAEPTTAQGAMALASAYRGLGNTTASANLIRTWWRSKTFDADVQRTMLARFGDVLTADDHARRADIMLYGAQGPASRDMVAMLGADQQQAAAARLALRADSKNASDLVAALTPEMAATPGVVFERAAWLRRKGLDAQATAQLQNFPRDAATPEQADRIWDERYRLVLSSLKNGDAQAAYAAAANSGLTSGADAADAEFYAGWIALTRLNDPAKAERHFQALERIGTSSITRGRALYWMGRTAEARHDKADAQEDYGRAARYYTTFYGQLAAEKLGHEMKLGADPVITSDIRARFEGREAIQATRLFWDAGLHDLYRVFAVGLSETLPSSEDEALMIDMARGYGEQDLSMKIARTASQRGFILPQRAYPFRTPPEVANAPEPALVLAITRQESGFNPTIRSGAGARGMMQLMPTTRGHRRAQDGGQLFGREAGRRRLQHAAGLQLPGPVGQPVLRLLRDGRGGLQRRTRTADPVVVVLRRPARLDGPDRLHRVHTVHRDPQLCDAGDREHGGLPRQAERRIGSDHHDQRPAARRLWLSDLDTAGGEHRRPALVLESIGRNADPRFV